MLSLLGGTAEMVKTVRSTSKELVAIVEVAHAKVDLHRAVDAASGRNSLVRATSLSQCALEAGSSKAQEETPMTEFLLSLGLPSDVLTSPWALCAAIMAAIFFCVTRGANLVKSFKELVPYLVSFVKWIRDLVLKMLLPNQYKIKEIDKLFRENKERFNKAGGGVGKRWSAGG